jgi:hypothetical protein
VALRWYLSPLTGDGTIGTRQIPGNPFRAVAQDAFRAAIVSQRQAGTARPSQFSALIATAANGSPSKNYALCEIDLPAFTDLDANANLALLAADLSSAPSAAVDSALTKFGLSRDVKDTTMRAVVNRVRKTLVPAARDR